LWYEKKGVTLQRKKIDMKAQQARLWILLVMCSLSMMVSADSLIKLQPERLPDMTIPRISHSTFIINGELTVVGGHTSGFVPTKTAEYFKDGEWHVMQMAYTHDDGLCVPLRSGKVLLAGGYEKNLGVGQTIEAELYDPVTHTFEGFGCLDRRRAHPTGVELPNGQVVVAGNWYHDDAIETYDGGMYFETARQVSVPRSFPRLLCISDSDVMVVSGYWDNYGKVIKNNIIDRLKGEPFRVPLLETWQPYIIGQTPRSDNSFIGDMEKGIFAYLLTVRDSAGQVAISEVRDTVFSLLPTDGPVPMKTQFGAIHYESPVIVDRQVQRGYVMGGDSLGRKYILCIDYAKRPAPLTLYYTDPLPEAAGGIPVLTAEGNLILAGGIALGGTYFTPTSAVWIFPVGQRTDSEAADSGNKSLSGWMWILLVALIILALIAWVLYRTRRNRSDETRESSSNEPTEPVPASPANQLMQRIEALMEEQRLYLNSDLKMGDVASQLGVHQNEVSACINNSKGYSFSQFVNNYRVVYAQQQLREHPEKKMSQVGMESGFANDTTFYRVFKTITGLTPSEWLLSVSEN
jgi:AraC-like DNA-binding protein